MITVLPIRLILIAYLYSVTNTCQNQFLCIYIIYICIQRIAVFQLFLSSYTVITSNMLDRIPILWWISSFYKRSQILASFYCIIICFGVIKLIVNIRYDFRNYYICSIMENDKPNLSRQRYRQYSPTLQVNEDIEFSTFMKKNTHL